MSSLRDNNEMFSNILELRDMYHYLKNESKPKILRKIRSNILLDKIEKLIVSMDEDYIIDYELLLSYIDNFEHCKRINIEDIGIEIIFEDQPSNKFIKTIIIINVKIYDDAYNVYTLSLGDPKYKDIYFTISNRYDNGKHNIIYMDQFKNIVDSISIDDPKPMLMYNETDIPFPIMSINKHVEIIKDSLLLSILEFLKIE